MAKKKEEQKNEPKKQSKYTYKTYRQLADEAKLKSEEELEEENVKQVGIFRHFGNNFVNSPFVDAMKELEFPLDVFCFALGLLSSILETGLDKIVGNKYFEKDASGLIKRAKDELKVQKPGLIKEDSEKAIDEFANQNKEKNIIDLMREGKNFVVKDKEGNPLSVEDMKKNEKFQKWIEKKTNTKFNDFISEYERKRNEQLKVVEEKEKASQEALIEGKENIVDPSIKEEPKEESKEEQGKDSPEIKKEEEQKEPTDINKVDENKEQQKEEIKNPDPTSPVKEEQKENSSLLLKEEDLVNDEPNEDLNKSFYDEKTSDQEAAEMNELLGIKNENDNSNPESNSNVVDDNKNGTQSSEKDEPAKENQTRVFDSLDDFMNDKSHMEKSDDSVPEQTENDSNSKTNTKLEKANNSIPVPFGGGSGSGSNSGNNTKEEADKDKQELGIFRHFAQNFATSPLIDCAKEMDFPLNVFCFALGLVGSLLQTGIDKIVGNKYFPKTASDMIKDNKDSLDKDPKEKTEFDKTLDQITKDKNGNEIDNITDLIKNIMGMQIVGKDGKIFDIESLAKDKNFTKEFKNMTGTNFKDTLDKIKAETKDLGKEEVKEEKVDEKDTKEKEIKEESKEKEIKEESKEKEIKEESKEKIEEPKVKEEEPKVKKEDPKVKETKEEIKKEDPNVIDQSKVNSRELMVIPEKDVSEFGTVASSEEVLNQISDQKELSNEKVLDSNDPSINSVDNIMEGLKQGGK